MTEGMSPDQPGTRLTAERWREVEAVFLATRARGPSERAAFLAQACGADVALRQEVESLLAADLGATGFLEPALCALNTVARGSPWPPPRLRCEQFAGRTSPRPGLDSPRAEGTFSIGQTDFGIGGNISWAGAVS
jgi:hypothetical protein